MTLPQAAFRALADPTRRAILQRLTAQELSIAEVAAGFDMTRAAVKKHLTVLSDGGLVSMTQEGRSVITRIEPAGFAPVRDWLSFFDRYWDDKLNSLKSEIEKGHNS